MGAYIRFRLTDPEQAAAANEWLQAQHEDQAVLAPHRRCFRFVEDDEELIPLDRGEEQIKVSGHPPEERDEVFDAWAALFERLHDHDQFEVEVLASSCGIDPEHYLSQTQLRAVTDDGAALSGPEADAVRAELFGAEQAQRSGADD